MERRFLSQALSAARQQEAAAKPSECNTVVAIVRMDEALLALKAPDVAASEGPEDRDATALAGTMLGREVTAELSAVLNARARPGAGTGRRARKADRMAPKADRGENDVWLAPQEGSVWRKSRPGTTEKLRQFQGARDRKISASACSKGHGLETIEGPNPVLHADDKLDGGRGPLRARWPSHR